MLINGIAFSAASLDCVIYGRPLIGVMAIDYWDETEKENNYGMGRFPISRGEGQYKAGASITLTMEAFEAIQNSLPPGIRIQDIAPTDMIVHYITKDLKRVVHTIKDFEFTKQQRKVSKGDKQIGVECSLIVSQIKWS